MAAILYRLQGNLCAINQIKPDYLVIIGSMSDIRSPVELSLCT